jgi:hypothetical protein
MRRRWDYFVKYLAGSVPPEGFQPVSYQEMIRKLYGPED